MESIGSCWFVLIWSSEIFEFFTVLKEKLGPMGFKMVTLSFPGFSLCCHVFKISR